MNPYLVPALELSPVVVERLLRQIPAARLDAATAEGRFTAREVIAHLADWEPIMRARIQQASERPGSTIEVFDEGEMALANGYAAADPTEQIRLFQRERAVTAAFVRSLQPGDWSKAAHHPERGTLSVDDLANLLIGHDLYHIEQLSAYLPGASITEG